MPSVTQHKDLPPADIHAPFAWRVADEDARNSLTVTNADVGKLLLQGEGEETSSWLLLEVGPPVVWAEQITGNDARMTNDRTASGIRTLNSIVLVSGSAQPLPGYILTAISGEAAEWQEPGDANKVSRAGDSMQGPLDMGANKVTSTYTAVNPEDLVNKAFLESITGGGAVAGPGSSTVDNIVTWNNTTGTLVKDSGLNAQTLVPFTAKGDILSRSSSVNTVLPVGSNDQILVVDSTTTTGLAWSGDIGELYNYYLGTFIQGVPNSSETVFQHAYAKNQTLKSTFAGRGTAVCVATAQSNATMTSVYSIRKNGIQIATVTFTSGSATGVYGGIAGDVSFTVGDLVSIVAPATIDASLIGISFTIVTLRAIP